MKVLTKSEIEKWMQEANWPIKRNAVDVSCFLEIGKSILPTDAGAKISLARELSRFFKESDEVLFWVTAWGIWHSCENMDLFRMLRKGMNEERSLDEAPGHLIQAGEQSLLECLLDVSSMFFWDVWVLDKSKRIALRLSHDEDFYFYCNKKEDFKHAMKVIGAYSPKEKEV